MIAVRLPNEIQNRLQSLADVTGRTKTYYVREAILEYLDDLEDWYLAEKISADIRSGKEETISIEDLMKEYEMAN